MSQVDLAPAFFVHHALATHLHGHMDDLGFIQPRVRLGDSGFVFLQAWDFHLHGRNLTNCMTNVKLTGDDFRALEALVVETASKLERPIAGLKVAARAVGNHTKKHFTKRNQVTNKRGWKRQFFWAQIRDSVQVTSDDVSATIVVNDPRFLLKVFGGTVRPKVAKALAIPLKEEFYGVNPSTFPRDKFILVKSKKGKNLGILAEKLPDGSLRLAYVLKRQTQHKPDPDALPPLDELLKVAADAIQGVFDRELLKRPKQ